MQAPVDDPMQSLKEQTCLVIGGGGFLGSALTRRLLSIGARVRVFGRHDYPALSSAGAECVRGDILDRDFLMRAVTGVDIVFHTASLCGIANKPSDYFRVNVDGTAQVLAACRMLGVNKLIYTSTPSVVIGKGDIIDGDETLPYARTQSAPYPASKMRAEQLVLKADSDALRTCAIRPHLMWGEDDPHIIPVIIKLARPGRLCIVGSGTNIVSLTHVENAAHAHVLAANSLLGDGTCAGKAYFVNDTESVVLWQWINALVLRLGFPPLRRHISRAFMHSLAACDEAVHRCLPFLGVPRMTRFIVDQLARSHSFSHAKATRDFGYNPVTSPAEGMERLVDALQARGIFGNISSTP